MPAGPFRGPGQARIGKHRESIVMEFVKKNPWVILVALFAVLIAVGIGVS